MRIPTWSEALEAHNHHKDEGVEYRGILYTYSCPGCGKQTSTLGMDFALVERFEGRCADCYSTRK